jgi:hypothetical protein
MIWPSLKSSKKFPTFIFDLLISQPSLCSSSESAFANNDGEHAINNFFIRLVSPEQMEIFFSHRKNFATKIMRAAFA